MTTKKSKKHCMLPAMREGGVTHGFCASSCAMDPEMFISFWAFAIYSTFADLSTGSRYAPTYRLVLHMHRRIDSVHIVRIGVSSVAWGPHPRH